MDRHLFDKWLSVAEANAKLPKLKGGLWHPYGRKWATLRRNTVTPIGFTRPSPGFNPGTQERAYKSAIWHTP